MTTRQVRDRLARLLREAGCPDVLSVDTADDDRLQISVFLDTAEVEVWEVRVRRVEEER